MELPPNRYLGRLCKRGHDWEGTGKSLRYSSNCGCVECRRVFQKEYYSRPDIKIHRASYLKERRNIPEVLDRYNQPDSIEKRREYRNKFSNKEGFKARKRAYEKKATADLTDATVRKMFAAHGSHLKAKDIPQSLIELKRIQLKLKRRLRNG